jgi:hypothetical protein
MTRTQQRALGQLKSIGGAGWVGPAVSEDGRFKGLDEYLRNVRQFWGKKEYDRVVRTLKKHNVTDKGVKCSVKTLQFLLSSGLVTDVEGLVGVYILADKSPEA